MDFAKRFTLTVLAIIGFITSIKLTLIYWDVNFNPYALASFCSISEFVDCDGVAKTTHSQFLGVPLACWGLFLYFVFLFFIYVDKLKNINIKNFRIFAYFDVFKNPLVYISVIGVIAFSFSMLLAGLSIFEIKKICILCFFTYVLNLLIAVVAKPKDISFIDLFKISWSDFLSAVKIKKYAIALSAVLLVAFAILFYTSSTNVMAPQVQLKKEMKAYKSTGNILGDENASVVVHLYTDYQCPFCFVLNTMLHRAVSELKNIKIVHHNLPLDMNCNKNLSTQMHDGSCLMAKYAIAAGKQGKFWDLNNLLFDNDFQGEESIIKYAKTVRGLNIEKLKQDASSELVATELDKEINDAVLYGIDGTPALRINLETKVGIMPYEELKAKLIKAGAVER